jgi:hypothetical protein
MTLVNPALQLLLLFMVTVVHQPVPLHPPVQVMS